MRCTTHHRDPSGRVTQHHHSFSPQQVADFWSTGGTIAARQVIGKNGKPTFDGADFVAVQIDLGQLPLCNVLDSGFTQRYCTVARTPGESPNPEAGYCLLAFKLPYVVTDAK